MVFPSSADSSWDCLTAAFLGPRRRIPKPDREVMSRPRGGWAAVGRSWSSSTPSKGTHVALTTDQGPDDFCHIAPLARNFEGAPAENARMTSPAINRPAPAGHEHLVLLYDDEQDLVQRVVRFLIPGLLRNEAMLVVATARHRTMFASALAAIDPELPAHRAAGRYVELDAEEALAAFLHRGSLSRMGFNTGIGHRVRALSEEHGRVHIYGEMVACLWNRGDARSALQLEHLWNDLACEQDFRLCCAYHNSLLQDKAEVDDMLATHSSVHQLNH